MDRLRTLQKNVISKFTAFEDATLEFSRGVNVFLGANATGKTHVMKLACSIVKGWRDLETEGDPGARRSNALLVDRLATRLTPVFRPDDRKLGGLVRRSRGRKKSTIELDLDARSIDLSLTTLGNIDLTQAGKKEIPDSNPTLTKIVSDFLLRLSGNGIQVFIASHDYLPTNELSLNAEYAPEAANNAPIRFFAFGRTADGSVEGQLGATLAELRQNPIMEEIEALYDRERGLFFAGGRPAEEGTLAWGVRRGAPAFCI